MQNSILSQHILSPYILTYFCEKNKDFFHRYNINKEKDKTAVIYKPCTVLLCGRRTIIKQKFEKVFPFFSHPYKFQFIEPLQFFS